MRSNNKRVPKNKERTCSPMVLLSWVLILAWFGFIFYFWKSGYLVSDKIPSLAVVDKIITTAEKSLRNVHIKVATSPVDFGKDSSSPKNEVKAHVPVKESAGEGHVHVVFSTDCTGFQDWQTLTVFYSASAVGQKGPITRIASGCDDEKKAKLTALYGQLYPNYHVHFTPDFKMDAKTKRKYDFYNKPYGLRHWLDNASPPIESGVVIALIDPDMLFLRPITTKVKGEVNLLYSSGIKEDEIFDEIGRGRPVGQQYGLGAPWANDKHPKFDRHRVCGEDSPCLGYKQGYAEHHFSVGPPYILEKEDFHRIANTWCDFVPKVYEKYPYLLAEMYAYSIASAHEALPHLQLDHYMVSNTEAGGEGWDWVDPLDDVCAPPVNGIYFPDKPLPTLVHFCQGYQVEGIGFWKRRFPHNSFSCEAPLLTEPSLDLGISQQVVFAEGEQKKVKKLQGKRNAFMVCAIIRIVNAALTDYKQRMCKDDPKTNYAKTLSLA